MYDHGENRWEGTWEPAIENDRRSHGDRGIALVDQALSECKYILYKHDLVPGVKGSRPVT